MWGRLGIVLSMSQHTLHEVCPVLPGTGKLAVKVLIVMLLVMVLLVMVLLVMVLLVMVLVSCFSDTPNSYW